MANVVHRRIWVKRPGASATRVQIREDDLVDDVRDVVLQKYGISLGRTFDAPDLALWIVQRADRLAERTKRLLGPEEDMCKTIDAHYPGGQTLDEALVIIIPQSGTPKASPRFSQAGDYQTNHALRPVENGSDYFSATPGLVPSPLSRSLYGIRQQPNHSSINGHSRSTSVSSSGHVPPSSFIDARRRHREHRPKMLRQQTCAPAINAQSPGVPTGAVNASDANPAPFAHSKSDRSRRDSSTSKSRANTEDIPAAPPLPRPVPSETLPMNQNGTSPLAQSVASLAHPPEKGRSRSASKSKPDKPSSKKWHQEIESKSPEPAIQKFEIDSSVPPINVLLVEDNNIQLRVLEKMMKRLKVRWETAMNGQVAVDKWKAGGFHLVLMDIQMPIKNGLQATKEIRELERANGIGAFASTEHADAKSVSESDGVQPNKQKESACDKLLCGDGFFNSPTIIVALTASSLDSDRHEALAAGCNDFLTKPVDMVWMEQKVKEWGCMQALIDFAGWRKWKGYATQETTTTTTTTTVAVAE